MSPTTRATGPSATAAEPSAVETTPSIPFAPRLERTVIARSVEGSQASMSRTGMELDAQRTAPSGSASASRGHGTPSKGSSNPASQASIASVAVRSAASQSAAHAASPARPADSPARAANRAASASRVAAGSACTNVAGSSEASRQPASPSSTSSSGRVRSSSPVSGLDVGIAPVRITRSGTWASIQGPGRTSWSALTTTRLRSCGPVRRPESGSARIGKPVTAASATRAWGSSESSSGPATMRPRSARASRSASMSMVRSSRDRRPVTTSTNGVGQLGAPPPCASGPSGSNGSRNGTLTCTGPAGPAAATATARPATQRQCASVASALSSKGSSVNHFAARP